MASGSQKEQVSVVPVDHGVLLELPTHVLLDKFGAGSHKPGSGSAAALLTLVSCKLLDTVVSLTKGRERYGEVLGQLTLAVENIARSLEPRLVNLLQEDSAQFARVINARRDRDRAGRRSPDRRRLQSKARQELRIATDIPLEIAELSIGVARNALLVFDLGFQSARGDSGVAITSAIAGASGALSIVYLNLTDFRDGKWARGARQRADGLLAQVQQLQEEFIGRVGQLRGVSATTGEALAIASGN